MNQKQYDSLYEGFKQLSARAIKKQIKALLRKRQTNASKHGEPTIKPESGEIVKDRNHPQLLTVSAKVKIKRTQKTEPKHSKIPIESLDEFANRTPESGWHYPLHGGHVPTNPNDDEGGHILAHPTQAGNRTRWIRIVDRQGRTVEFILATADLTAQVRPIKKRK